MNSQDQLDLAELCDITDNLNTVACALVVVDDMNGYYNVEELFEEADAALDYFVTNLRVYDDGAAAEEVLQAGMKCIILRADVRDALADVRLELT